MKTTCPIVMARTATFALAILIAGCPSTPLCEVDEAQIVINESSTPSVPDQIVGGCFSVSVVRTYANDAERELILRAESEPSTVGSTPFSSTLELGYHTKISEVANAEALTNYVTRVRDFRSGEVMDSIPILAVVEYEAQVVDPTTIGEGNSSVQLSLYYKEAGPSFWAGVSWTSAYVTREIVFDSALEITEIRGDGEVTIFNAN